MPACTSVVKHKKLGFPGGTVVKKPPANAGDAGLIPGPGRFHLPRSNWDRELQPLKPPCLQPVLRNEPRTPQPERARSQQQEPCTPQPERARSQQREPRTPQPERAHSQQREPCKPQPERARSQQREPRTPQPERARSQQRRPSASKPNKAYACYKKRSILGTFCGPAITVSGLFTLTHFTFTQPYDCPPTLQMRKPSTVRSGSHSERLTGTAHLSHRTGLCF